MRAKCFIAGDNNNYGPEFYLQIARKVDVTKETGSILGVKYTKKTTTSVPYGYDIRNALTEYGAIHLERDYSSAPKASGNGTRNPFSVERARDGERGDSLFVAGDRNSILEMFRTADQKPMIYVNLPPGVFVGVYRKERLFKGDITIVRITSGKDPSDAPQMSGAGFKHGNLYSKQTGSIRWRWHWFDVTKNLGVDTKGTTTIHPGALELPLKTIFDKNKWW